MIGRHDIGDPAPDRESASLRSLLDELDWSLRHLADQLGCHPNLVRAWLSGRVGVPKPVETWLSELVVIHRAHPPPKWRTNSAVP